MDFPILGPLEVSGDDGELTIGGPKLSHLYLMRVADEELFLVNSGTTPSWRPEGP